MRNRPLVTIAVPSFNQGEYLNDALISIFEQNLPVEVFVLDNASTDKSVEVIKQWEKQLAGWRSFSDKGQSASINEGISQGTAPYVCWLNSDDWFLPNGLQRLVGALEQHPNVPAVYGHAWNAIEWIESFNQKRLSQRCIISQPATLIRRQAWESVGGLDTNLHLAMDYDLWWRLFHLTGPLQLINEFIAVNRIHTETKTKRYRRRHYQEAINVVRQHYGSVPWKWWLLQPYAVWFKSIFG
jgi:glycosyltransferase involved in cell wall biosynthesis